MKLLSLFFLAGTSAAVSLILCKQENFNGCETVNMNKQCLRFAAGKEPKSATYDGSDGGYCLAFYNKDCANPGLRIDKSGVNRFSEKVLSVKCP